MYVTAIRAGQIVAAYEVTAQSGGSLTISGAEDGYSDAAMQAGDLIECRPMAGHFNEIWTTARGAITFGVSGTPVVNATTPPILVASAITLTGMAAGCGTGPSGGSATVQLQTSTDGVTWSNLSGAVVSITNGNYSGTSSPTNAISANMLVRAQWTAVNGAANETVRVTF
jgi:hypothetical protein